MKKLILFAGLVCVLQLGTMWQNHLVYPLDSQISEIARTAVSELAEENYAAVLNRFDETMKYNMPTARLRELWKSATSQAGAFKYQGAVRQERSGSDDVVFVTCQFDRAPLDIELDFNDQQQITGLSITPAFSAALLADAQVSVPEAKEGLVGVWQGSAQAGLFLGRLLTIQIGPSGFLGPIQFYSIYRRLTQH